MKRSTTGLLVGLILVLAQPQASFAQVGVIGEACSVTQDGYGPGMCEPPDPIDPTPPITGGSLPFTGADAGLVGGAGLLLLLMGAAMRRATRVERPPGV